MSNVERFIEILESQKWHLYHFTDTRNIDNIRLHGLLATAEIRRKNLPVIFGGNQWSLDADIAKGMDRYVHLCFLRSHPMEYIAKQQGRIRESCFLKIKPAVLRTFGTLISKDVSNKAGANLGPIESMIENIDLEVIYTRADWRDENVKERLKAAKKSEALIPLSIPLNLIEL